MAATAAAASRFAAALFHRRTRRVTSALAYAVLEWTLIALLLINGLFSYAIARFAAYFGLRPPCLLCSRVDRLFEKATEEEDGARWLRSVLCGAHAAEISGLGNCLHHGRLADAGDMCEACLSSSKEESIKDAGEESATVCSCCYAVVKTSSRELPDKGQGQSEEKTTEEDRNQGYVPLAQEEHGEEEDQGYVILAQEEHDEEDEEEHGEFQEEERQEEVDDKDEQEEKMAAVQDESLEVMAVGEEIELDGERLVSVAAIDEMTIADESGLHQACCEKEKEMDHIDGEHELRDLDIGVVLEEKRMLDSSAAAADVAIEDDFVVPVPCAEPVTSPPDPHENIIPHDDELVIEDVAQIGDATAEEETVEEEEVETAEEEEIVVPEVIEEVSEDDNQLSSLVIWYASLIVFLSVTEAVPEDDNRSAEVDTNCEVSIGSEICEREQDDHVVPFHESAEFEEPTDPLAYPDEQPLPLESLHETDPTAQASETEQEEEATASQRLDQPPNEQNEVEDDKAPETPTYSVATQISDKKFLLERKRSLSLSLDGSVASEMELSEPSTVDQLKSALQAERKALSALYSELEEERSAAAIATNQTMAMINRLQEEKAAMQMEALQYQRMMEEQSEYDQEALQLLNELVTKREREKQELERELDMCRQKVLHYEDKERRRMASFKANGHSPNGNGTSVSSSGEDSDGHSDEYCELGESPDGSNLQSPSDATFSPRTDQENKKHLVALDDSLTYFEMERLSILEELKTLEERLFTLEDDDINDTSAAVGRSSDEYELSADGLHSPGNGDITSDKAKFEGRNSICRGKSLLPLFDAAGDESSDQTPSARVGDVQVDNSTKPVSVLVKEQERLAIIEEVDHVYERLQALEADKEFLRHCIKSLKKGDRGMDLLQEILQHLRELRSVELHVKHAGDALAANSA
ncbi:myosin-binding protein 3-like isoform X2 [Oryza glaberrima]|uniref:myosin-binding protein 3-like isoform X2 n=1 Tax=Oryza glaberrima TaxID=4538 RepID=UPI00224C08AD|nr:myosin-binding protein 3-like isoform X2 [Oryza glaberrima]